MEDKNKNREKESEVTPEGNRIPIPWLRTEFEDLAKNLHTDLERALKDCNDCNTIEPLIELFESALALIALLYSGYRMLNESERTELLNCKGCSKRDTCASYSEYKERIEMQKQGRLFEIPVIYSEEKH